MGKQLFNIPFTIHTGTLTGNQRLWSIYHMQVVSGFLETKADTLNKEWNIKFYIDYIDFYKFSVTVDGLSLAHVGGA